MRRGQGLGGTTIVARRKNEKKAPHAVQEKVTEMNEGAVSACATEQISDHLLVVGRTERRVR